eukprot:scaffold310696_cov20-Tisochrysis_lutea.AAC.1
MLLCSSLGAKVRCDQVPKLLAPSQPVAMTAIFFGMNTLQYEHTKGLQRNAITSLYAKEIGNYSALSRCGAQTVCRAEDLFGHWVGEDVQAPHYPPSLVVELIKAIISWLQIKDGGYDGAPMTTGRKGQCELQDSMNYGCAES